MGNRRLATGILLALATLAAPAQQRNIPDAAAAPRANPSGDITEIVLERGSSCDVRQECPADVLVLHPDGTAEYFGIENTRLKGYFTGEFPARAFDQLAQMLVTEGFFGLEPSYGYPALHTTRAWIEAARGDERKRVTSHSVNYSEKVGGISVAIREVGADIQWQPARSGIRITTLWKFPGEDWRPGEEGYISISPEKPGPTPSGRATFPISTNQEGKAEITLAPGTYQVSGRNFAVPTVRTVQTVVVQPGRFTEVTIRYEVP